MQQEINDRESELETAYGRLESGDPPNDAIESEWKRLERTQDMRRREILTKKQVRPVLRSSYHPALRHDVMTTCCTCTYVNSVVVPM